MRIALLTIHYANSYGGMLQAYATKVLLQRFGEVHFLNYRTKHLADNMRVVTFPRSFRELLRAGKNILRYLPRRRLLNRFHIFQNSYFPQTDVLQNRDDLRHQLDRYDVFVSGSDQIWNPRVIESFDPAYFLEFASDKKKIAFASSAGSYRYSAQEAKKVNEYLNAFDAIGVREADFNDYLTSLLGRGDIETVLDPTLIFNAQDWQRELGVCVTPSEKPYLLIYALKLSKENRKLVDRISSKLGLHIVAIDQEPILRYHADEHLNDLGPVEYLRSIANASFVITDSFHGTAFSINFNIPFISIPPRSGVNRIMTLLSALGLEERFMSSDDVPELEFSFDVANARLQSLRETSMSFIERQLT